MFVYIYIQISTRWVLLHFMLAIFFKLLKGKVTNKARIISVAEYNFFSPMLWKMLVKPPRTTHFFYTGKFP